MSDQSGSDPQTSKRIRGSLENVKASTATASHEATKAWATLSNRYGRGPVVGGLAATLALIVVIVFLSLRSESATEPKAGLPTASNSTSATAVRPSSTNRDDHAITSPPKPVEMRTASPSPVVAEVSPDVQRKIDALGRGTYIEQMQAAQELGQMRVAAAIPALGKLLANRDNNLREAAIDALGGIANDDASRAMLDYALTQQESDADLRISDALIKLGRPEHLIQLVKAHPSTLRAIRKLGELRSKEAVPVLMHLVQTDASSDVRGNAMWALASIGDPRAAEAIIPLTRSDEIEAEDAVKALRILKAPQAFDHWREMAERRGRFYGEALLALGELGDKRAYDILVKAHAESRQMTGVALGTLGDRRALPLLIADVNDRNKSGMHAGAADGLGLLKDPEAVQPLIDLLNRGSNDSETQLAAINALAALKDKRALEVLKIFTQSGDRDVRVAALNAVDVIDKAR